VRACACMCVCARVCVRLEEQGAQGKNRVLDIVIDIDRVRRSYSNRVTGNSIG